MQKNNIRMVVQGESEVASQFAERLELICAEICDNHKDKISTPPIVILTASSSGRQTATLQFITIEKDAEDPLVTLFNNYHIYDAYENFKKSELLQTPQTDALIQFLISQKMIDYVNS